jgi:threonine/homoserine/homoserine lactone efflux protein
MLWAFVPVAILVTLTHRAAAVRRAKQAVVRTRVARWVERVTGAVLLALGVRVALEG